ncbi:MAG TPA: hypothetical protein VN708_26525 [Terriglobales bacterium]|nr:hypothetical protein [Terriglobales bacterium]
MNPRTSQTRFIVAGKVSFCTFAIALFCSCGAPPEQRTSAHLLKGDFASALQDTTKWARKHPADPIPHFVASVCYYFLEKFDACSAERQTALASKDNVAAVIIWVRGVAETNGSPISHFLLGVAAELREEEREACDRYREAYGVGKTNHLYHYCHLAADQTLHWEALVPEDQPLSYKGEMELANKSWIPTRDFQVTGGIVSTLLGDCTNTATFGTWRPVVTKQTNQRVSWAAMLNSGRILIRAEEDSEPAGTNQLDLVVTCGFRKAVFDYFGRYFLVELDAQQGETYPLIPVPHYMTDDETWSGKLVLGTELTIAPEQFTPLRSFGKNRNAVSVHEDAALYRADSNPTAFAGMYIAGGHRQALFGNLRSNVKSGKMSGPIVRASRL